MKFHSKEVRAEIVRRALNLESYTSIGKSLGLSRAAVAGVVWRHAPVRTRQVKRTVHAAPVRRFSWEGAPDV